MGWIVRAYPVKITDSFSLEMPKGAILLDVRLSAPKAGQVEFLRLIAATSTEVGNETRKFCLGLVDSSIELKYPATSLKYVGMAALKKGTQEYTLFELLPDIS